MPPTSQKSRLECPSCGAPLRWKGHAPVVACRYCDAHVHTPTGKPTHEPAVVRSQGRASGGCAIPLVVVGLVSIIGLIAAVASILSSGTGGLTGVSMATLTALSLEGDNATVAQALGLAPDAEGDDLHVPLRGSDFDYAYLRWDDEHPEHVASFGLYANDGHPSPAALEAALEQTLGRRLEPEQDGYRYWRWAGANLNLSVDGSHLGGHTLPEDDAHWAYRTRLLWSVVLAAAQGQALELQPSTLESWLAHGYDISELAAMSLDYDVDGASAYTQATFPGSHATVFISLDVDVPLAHPWFGDAELSWPNEPGGKLASAQLHPPPGHQTFPDQQPIRACLDRALGAGETSVDDHLAGTWSARWELPDGTWLHLSRYSLGIHRDRGHGPARATAASWRRVLNALQACGTS